MKKIAIIVASLGLVVVGIWTGRLFAAAQPQNFGYAKFDNPTQLFSQTKAQITVLAPDAVGQLIYCNNCTQTPICASTATIVGSWAGVSVSTQATNGFGLCQ